jgi:hypothetical protein
MEPTTRSILFLCLVLSAVTSSPASAQDSSLVDIQGTIVDSTTGLPIEDVEVGLAELGLHLLTDSEGRFAIPALRVGSYRLTLQKEGYREVEGRFASSGLEAWSFAWTLFPHRPNPKRPASSAL